VALTVICSIVLWPLLLVVLMALAVASVSVVILYDRDRVAKADE